VVDGNPLPFPMRKDYATSVNANKASFIRTVNNSVNDAALCVAFLFSRRKVGYSSGQCNRWLYRLGLNSALDARFWARREWRVLKWELSFNARLTRCSIGVYMPIG